jgi:hypothetical protein
VICRQPLLAALAGLLLAACATDAGSDAALDARISALEARVAAAEGVRAVKRLQHTYGHYLEAGLWDDLGELFAEDAVGEFGAVTVTGKNNLRRHFMEQAGRAELGLGPGQLNVHFQLQPIVSLGADGATAKATWHEVAMLGRYGESASWMGGVYENEYRREDGVWKISRIRFFEQYRGAYEDHGHTAPPAWNIPYHFEAAHVGVTIPAEALTDRGKPARASPPAPAWARIAILSARVDRLNDETAVASLQHALGYYVDRKMWDDAADLFADDASFEVANGGTYIGRERIRSALEAMYGPARLSGGELFDHVNLQTVVTLAMGERYAAARTSQLSQVGRNGDYARWELGVYENSFVKDGGVWKLAAVRYYPQLATDYDQGWAVDARPAPGVDDAFPPDRQPKESYGSYPNAQTIGFHYPNPVTGQVVQYPAGLPIPVPPDQPFVISDARSHGLIAAAQDGSLGAALDYYERQLDAAIAVDAVENLMSSYGYTIDESDWNAMADTFSETRGAKELTGAGTYIGRERIRTALNLRGPTTGRSPSFFTIHQLTQPVIHISEDGQSANARLRLFQSGGAADGSSGSWIGGIYENTAVFENGEWKLGRQDLTHTFNASYRNGWARVGPEFRAAAGPNVTGRNAPGGGITQGLGGARSPGSFAADFPPDAPIRARQYAFPEIVEPAFHYVNPVSGREPPELLP